jgi:predicted Zn-dependent protease
MKRWIILAGIVLLGVASVVVSERKKVDVPASPAAFLYLLADTEHELTRMPVSFTRLSDAEEVRVGNQLARFYASGQPENTPEDVIVLRYITRIGWQLSQHAHRKLPYQFHYIPDPYLVNAFALPGGHVYVGAGLLSLMDSEDQLAAVMAHELEHIDHYHCAERVQQEQALRKIPLGALVAIPIEIFEAGYSKDQELEADREGTHLAVETGYSAVGAIRMFETFDRLFREYHEKAATPQEEMSQVAQQTLEGYFRSHPLPSERIAQIQRMIASEGWQTHPERDLEVAYIFQTAKAQDALNAHKYSVAEQLAAQSLRTHPEQTKAWVLVARAQFAQANFSDAAKSYRNALDTGSLTAQKIAAYALSLAAADRHTAAAEFVKGTENLKSGKPRDLDVAAAGLALLNGNSQPAQALETEFRQSSQLQAPQWLGELGWWHYLAGEYQKSAELLSEAVQQRPQDIELGVRLAWAQAEIRRYADALQMLDENVYQPQNQSERMIARAVVRWQTTQQDEALRDYDAALNNAPEWGNPKWVSALFSPLVAKTVHEMQLESENRKRKAKLAATR